MIDIPTTAELRAEIVAGMESSLSQTVPLLPKAFIRVLATVLAGVLIVLYKYAGFQFQQLFISTATINETTVNGQTIRPLVEWGRLVGEGDPTPATAASVTIDVVTEGAATVPAGSQFIHQATGVIYTNLASESLTAGSNLFQVLAVGDSAGTGGLGAQGNRIAGEQLRLVTPITGVPSFATVTGTATTAADAESVSAYRKRVLNRFRSQPQGGAYADYRTWAEGVSGISAAYPYTGATPGQVDVYVESSTEVDGIPSAAQLTAVEDAIEFDDAGLASRRPANAFVNVHPITRLQFDIEIEGLVVDDEVQVKSDISDALTEFFLGREPFIEGLSAPPPADRITAANVSAIVERVVFASSGLFSRVVLTQLGSEVDVYILGEGEKAKLGTITYTT